VSHVDRKLDGMTQMLKLIIQRQEEMFDSQKMMIDRESQEEQQRRHFEGTRENEHF